ncbi:MAG TPA: hypothetical protein VMU45_00120 [Candidatus Eisenbacteria bacterium]|nr:hypothetical protein [Candidatus Eisenbacteria bacterium]
MDRAFEILALVTGSVLCLLVGGFGFLILWEIWVGNIDLSKLISEPTGDASMSRFQLLVFTFVIALSLFLVVVATQEVPNIPGTVLTLLGISGSSYLVSKGIQFSDPAGITSARGQDIVVSPGKISVGYGQKQQFTAQVPNKPGAAVKWLVLAGDGTIDQTGLYVAPPPPSPPLPSGTGAHATIQVTTDAFPDAYDLAVVTLV